MWGPDHLQGPEGDGAALAAGGPGPRHQGMISDKRDSLKIASEAASMGAGPAGL